MPDYAWEKPLVRADPATGYERAVYRTRIGAYCGYVRVPDSHPLYRVNYREQRTLLDEDGTGLVEGTNESIMERILHDAEKGIISPAPGEAPEAILSCHGGITYSGFLGDETEKEWWFGFDCAHLGDYVPGVADSYMEMRVAEPDNPLWLRAEEELHEWTEDEVWEECANLARQLKEIEDARKDAAGIRVRGAESEEGSGGEEREGPSGGAS